MAILELLTLNLGASLLKLVAKLWLGPSVSEGSTGPVINTFKKMIEDFETRRATERLFEDLTDQVARRMAEAIEKLFPAIPENEIEAATLAAADVFEQLSLDKSIFESDLDATHLEIVARPNANEQFRLLGSDAAALAWFLLRESCNFAVVIAGKMPNFQVSVTREILKRHRQLSGEIAAVLDTITAMRIDASQDATREAQNFELQYRRTLVRRLDRLELFGLRLIGAGASVYPLSVAYVTLTATSSTAVGEPQRADAALAGKQRILIRGEAGSGKSTLLQWLAVRAASRDFADPLLAWNDRIPFYIRLRDYAERKLPPPEGLLENLTNLVGLMPEHWSHTALRHALVLIDGIDELPADRRREFSAWLSDLVSDFDGSIFIVSSRPAALDSEEPFVLGKTLEKIGFDTLTLEAMTLTDSEILVSQWHTAVAQDLQSESDIDQLQTYERDLRQILRERSPIRNLASNPLLCSMICALNWDRRQRLPDDRMELYRLAVEMLLERRDEERGVRAAHLKELRTADKQELLDSIAYWMLRNRYSEASQEKVEEQIRRILPRLAHVTAESETVLQELLERSGILRRPQHGVIDFVHRTFLEYMAARAAITAGDSAMLVEGARDESWREAIVFAAGHARGKARDEIVRELLKRRWWKGRALEIEVTAVCCLETVGGNLDPELLAKLRDLARSLFPPRNSEKARILAPAAAMEPELLEGHAERGEAAIAACVRTAATVGGARMLQAISTYAHIEGRGVDIAMLRAWSSFDLEEFAEKVIRKRASWLGCEVGKLNAEEIECLCALIEFESTNPDTLIKALNDFRTSRVLHLRNLERYDQEHDEVDGHWSRFLRSKARPVQGRKVPRPRRRVNAVRLSHLSSLRSLWLPHVEPATIAALSSLAELKELWLMLESPVNLEPIQKIQALETLHLEGPGVQSLGFMEKCANLKSILVGNSSISDLSGFWFPLGVRSISLFDVIGVKSFESVWAAVDLESLSLAIASIGNFDRLRRLKKLRYLEIMGVIGAGKIPFAELRELTYLSVSNVPVEVLSELQMAPRLRSLDLRLWDGGADWSTMELQPPDSVEELNLVMHPESQINGGRLRRLREISTQGYIKGIETALESPVLELVRWEVEMPSNIRRNLMWRGITIKDPLY